jgi:ATP-dependent Clp protease adaptor protein ClpS
MKNEEDREDIQPENALVEPGMYQVVLHSDDFTPIEFVLGMLQKYFYMERREAAAKTLEAHARGRSVCGVFSRDFAEAKLAQVMDYAKEHDHPLNCSMEAAL